MGGPPPFTRPETRKTPSNRGLFFISYCLLVPFHLGPHDGGLGRQTYHCRNRSDERLSPHLPAVPPNVERLPYRQFARQVLRLVRFRYIRRAPMNRSDASRVEPDIRATPRAPHLVAIFLLSFTVHRSNLSAVRGIGHSPASLQPCKIHHAFSLQSNQVIVSCGSPLFATRSLI